MRRTCRFVLLVGIMAGVGIAGFAEAQTLGPLCAMAQSTLPSPPSDPMFLLRVVATPTADGQLLLTGVEFVASVRPISGSASVSGTTAMFQLIRVGRQDVPTLFISGSVDTATGAGTGFCEGNTHTGVCGEGTPLTFASIPCQP